ncbi:MAG: pyridoxine 5'-phosphate synthase [Sphingobacteriales bacterium]|jgi:pyridoxine 5-phosphate synthase|nr:pyridoxine 5'-phosphate synthase [Sphingobacteriales bacterium]
MTRLSVNINKIATLRNARGGQIPDPVLAAVRIQEYGADGITVHPRPDGRHIRFEDVVALKQVVLTEFNIEGYPSESFMNLVSDVRPDQVTLVPDPPDALTSNAGWDTKKHAGFLKEIVARIKSIGCRVSIFLEPDFRLIESAAATGTDRIELYTESYAVGYPVNPYQAIEPFVAAARAAHECRLGVNAGHDLNLDNLAYFAQNVPHLDEVSIGHALISDALYLGLKESIARYRSCLQHGLNQ